jgi:hypothetical protein
VKDNPEVRLHKLMNTAGSLNSKKSDTFVYQSAGEKGLILVKSYKYGSGPSETPWIFTDLKIEGFEMHL